ncbi:MAG: hypothetical protein ACRDPH_04860 [Marmoricola sp.]
MATALVSGASRGIGVACARALSAGRTGVTLNAVCPSRVDTPLTERAVQEVAAAVMLCVDNAAINGQGRLTVDGGAVQS